MKISEIEKKYITETITFRPNIKTEKDGKTYITGDPFYVKGIVECPWCDGRITCQTCHGKGEIEGYKFVAPSLNVSNLNANTVLEMLGIEFDDSGYIENSELPNILRRLIKIKNQSVSQYTSPTTVDRGKTGAYTDPNTGLSTIGRGPTIHTIGRNEERILAYIDELIKIIRFAQQNNAGIGWG